MAGTGAPYRDGHGGGRAWIAGLVAVGIVVVLIVVVLLPLVQQRDDTVVDPGATAAEILRSPTTYVGETVTVSGGVYRVLDARAFTLGGPDFVGGDELLVVAEKPLPPVAGRAGATTISPYDIVQVTGPVRTLDPTTVESETGANLDEAALAGFAGKPYVVARAVGVTPRIVPAASLMRPLPQAAGTIDQIHGSADRFVGRRVTVSGTPTTVIGPHVFLLTDLDLLADESLLVIARAPLARPGDDASLVARTPLRVTGDIRALDIAAIEQEIGADLNDADLAAWIGKPIVLAREVIPTPEIDQIMTQLPLYLDRTVTVDGDVDAVLGPRALEIENDDPLFDEEILVLTGQQMVGAGRPDYLPYLAGDVVRVTGVVRVFDRATIERDIGVTLDDAFVREWEGEPVIVADEIRARPNLPRLG